MHLGLVAVRASVAEFRTAFSDTWPQLEVSASADRFSVADDVWAWKAGNERFVSARNWTKDDPGSVVYILCQDGPWAVLMDFSYVLAGDQKALLKLSNRFGSVLSFMVESAGGCAYFSSYDAGQLRRSIESVNGVVTSSGDVLPEEKNNDTARYYIEETEQLMLAFGLSAPGRLPVIATAVAIATIDRTDYGQQIHAWLEPKTDAPSSSSRSEKPWWRFW